MPEVQKACEEGQVLVCCESKVSEELQVLATRLMPEIQKAGGPGCAAGRPGCSFEGYGGGPGGQYKHNRPDSHRVTVQSWPGNGGSHWVTGVPRWRYRHRRVSQKCVVSATEGGEGVIGVGSAVSELT